MLFLFLLSAPALPLQAQVTEEEKDTGGIVEGTKSLFDRLRKKTGSDGSDGDDKKGGGLLDGIKKALDDERVKSLVDGVGDVWESSKDNFDSLLDSSSEANARIEQLLAYVDRKVSGREPSFTDEQIQAHAVRIIPIIEELNGRTFDAIPPVKSVGNFQMIQILARDLAPQIEKQLPDVPKVLIYFKAYLSAGLYAPSLLGKYGTEDRTVYVLPQNLHAIVEAEAIDARYEEDVLQIVIGHELTHGLQDQEIDLAQSILDAPDPDAMNAFNATIEGHAMFIENALAAKLGLDDAATAAAGLIMTEDLDDDAYLFERLAHVNAVQMEQVYLGGERFIRHHHKQGGLEKIWQLLAEPPLRSSMITQPATYSADPEPLPDFESEFAFALETSGLEDWSQKVSHLGDFDLRARLATVNGEQRETILRGVKQAAAVLMMDESDLGNSLEIAVFDFRSEAEAALMVEAIDDLSRRDLAEIEANSLVELLSRKEGKYHAGKDFPGSYRTSRTDALFIGKTTTTSVIVSNATLVVHLIDEGSGLKKAKIDALIQQLAAKLRDL